LHRLSAETIVSNKEFGPQLSGQEVWRIAIVSKKNPHTGGCEDSNVIILTNRAVYCQLAKISPGLTTSAGIH
jgi:hypothetical protein